jgi:hypothetical protein
MSMKTLDPEPEFTLGAAPSQMVEEAGRRLPAPERTVKPMAVTIGVLVVVGAIAFYLYWPRGVTLPQQLLPTPPASTSALPAEPEPAIQHPVEKIPVPAADADSVQLAIPQLDSSDIAAKDALETILNGDAFIRLLVPDGIIRHIVATVDNLPRNKVAPQILPIKPLPGPLTTLSTAQGMSIARDNSGRYAAYVDAAQAINTKRLTGFYVRLYPLLQQAYVELGYPDGYFNDRLISVIDHLLATPEPKPPVYVTQPRVMFEFVDPKLAELSAGQKILVRVGIDNELRLKAKLREIRKSLVADVANR